MKLSSPDVTPHSATSSAFCLISAAVATTWPSSVAWANSPMVAVIDWWDLRRWNLLRSEAFVTEPLRPVPDAFLPVIDPLAFSMRHKLFLVVSTADPPKSPRLRVRCSGRSEDTEPVRLGGVSRKFGSSPHGRASRLRAEASELPSALSFCALPESKLCWHALAASARDIKGGV